MKLSELEIKILMAESARESALQHLARCQRRVARAEEDKSEAVEAIYTLDAQINAMRAQFTLRAV